MRYGIVRDGDGLPPATLQRLGLERAACDLIVEEGRAAEQRRLDRLLLRLRSGDEVLVYSLAAFQRSAGEVAQLVRHLIRTGVVFRLAEENEKFVPIAKTKAARRIVELLAAHEDQRRGRPNAQNVRGGSRNPLSRFQIDYARKLHKQGAPLRTIGLIFQLPPDEIWELISEPRT